MKATRYNLELIQTKKKKNITWTNENPFKKLKALHGDSKFLVQNKTSFPLVNKQPKSEEKWQFTNNKKVNKKKQEKISSFVFPNSFKVCKNHGSKPKSHNSLS